MEGRSQIEVALFERGDNTGFIKVKLRSRVKSHLLSYKDIELNSVSSEMDMERAVEVTGGALAEYQNEHYGDTHDPSECAKVAREAFLEMSLLSATWL